MPFEFISTNAAAVSNIGKFGRKIRANRFYTHYKSKPGKLADFIRPTVAITLVTLYIAWSNITWFWKQFDSGWTGILLRPWTQHRHIIHRPYHYGAPYFSYEEIPCHDISTVRLTVHLVARYAWLTVQLSLWKHSIDRRGSRLPGLHESCTFHKITIYFRPKFHVNPY